VAHKLNAEDDGAAVAGAGGLGAVYLAHKDDLLTVVMCLLGADRPTAEDVLHDVFVGLARRPQPVVAGNVRNYLIAACLNRTRDLLRRREARAAGGDHAVEGASDRPGPARTLELDEEAARLLGALAALPAAQREVVAMHVHGRMTFRAIAEALGVSINTAQSRYRYALAALRKRLADSNEGVPR
jgi:RNA polymerase sigma-70 factor (ECF subfamily)